MNGVKQYLKNDNIVEIFIFAKSIRRKKAQWLKDTADYYFPHYLRTLYYGSGRKQFLKEKAQYFGIKMLKINKETKDEEYADKGMFIY